MVASLSSTSEEFVTCRQGQEEGELRGEVRSGGW